MGVLLVFSLVCSLYSIDDVADDNDDDDSEVCILGFGGWTPLVVWRLKMFKSIATNASMDN